MALRDLLLKISGDGDDAKRELAGVAKTVAEFGKQEAEAKIAVDAKQAETAIARAKRELRDYGRISVEAAAGVEIAKGEAQLERIKARLDNLARQEASPEVDAAVTKALLQLDRVQTRVDKLSRAEVKIDVDRGATGVFAAMATAVGGLVASIGSGGGGLTGATTRISAGFISFGAATGPVAAILAALAVTGVALVGALSALVASLAAAVAAVGVLATALAAALGPVLAVVIAAVVRFARVIQALKAQSAATQQAQQQAAAGSAAVTAAAEQQETAARALADANTRLGQATTQAYREMADAAEAASDAVLTLATAEDTRDQARLNTRKAVNDLAELRKEIGATGASFDSVFKKFTDVNVDVSGLKSALAGTRGGGGSAPDASAQLKLEQAILDVRTARNAEKRAIDGVSDAETNRTRTQQRANQFARQGIAASDGYASALRGVADAQRQVTAAAKQQGLAAAQAKAQVLTEKLSDSERKLLVVIQQVSAAIKTAFGPAVDAVFGGLITALQNITKLATTLKPAFTAIGAAIGTALAVFTGELVKPEWIDGLNELAAAGAELTGIFTADIFIPFLEILRNVAVAALPFLISGLQQFGDLLKGLAADASVGRLTPIFEILVDNLESWLRLAGALALVMVAFFKNAEGPGRRLVDLMTKGAFALAEWLNSKEGMAAVKRFFDETIPVAIEFVKAMVTLAGAFVRFGIAAAPAVKVVLDVFTFLLRHIKWVGLALVVVGAAFGSIWAVGIAAVFVVINFIKQTRDVLRTLKSVIDGVGPAFSSAFDAAKRAVSRAVDEMERRFNTFVAAARLIGEKIGRGLVAGIRAALGGIASLGRTIANSLIAAINFATQKINSLLPDKIALKGLPDINLPDNPIPRIPKLAAGGILTAAQTFIGGEKGKEAVLPLTKRVFADLGAAIAANMRLALPGPARPGLAIAAAGAGAGGTGGGINIEHQEIVLKTPGGGTPDGRMAGVLIGRELARMG